MRVFQIERIAQQEFEQGVGWYEHERLNTGVSTDVSVTDETSSDAWPVLISVCDDGSGIPADVLPRIFEPHFSTSTSGSGLGLAISRRLVEGWGGDISVESTEGKGAIVVIRLRASSRGAQP